MASGLALCLTLPWATAASAGPSADALATCLAENTSGKDRKELARWVFVSMATHPEIRALTVATDADREQSSKFMGAAFTRLVADACPAQARAAIQNEGAKAMEVAFGALGQLAMQEMMANAEVSAAMGAFERYLDVPKLQSVLVPR